MEWVETTGKTVEAALDAALDELGVDEDDVEFEVVTQPKTGFLGMGKGDARIRARVKPVSREKPGDRQRRQRRSGGKQERNGQRGGSRSRGSRPDSPGRSGSSGAQGAGSGEGDRAPATVAAGGAAASGRSGSGDADAADADRPPARRRRRGGRGRSRGGAGNGVAQGSSTGGDRPPREREDTDVATMETELPIEEQAAIAEAFTIGLVDAFELGGEVATTVDDDAILIDVTGSDLGLLVGPRGATLHAIEELVRTVVQRQTDGRGARINVDVASYRAKRRAALEDFTRGLAEKVLDSGKSQALEPMSAVDRKTVHDAASEIDGISTSSEGEEPRRRVVLHPA